MELHGENDFKARSYSKMAETLDYCNLDLCKLTEKELTEIEGVGKSSAQKIVQIVDRERFDALDNLLEKTPEGVLEMIGISGFGPKKIGLLWKDAGAESLDELLVLCEQGKVAGVKGFAEKSQEKLQRAVEFKISNRGYLRYSEAEPLFQTIISDLKDKLAIDTISETGELRRRMDVINCLEVLIGYDDFAKVRTEVSALAYLSLDEKTSGPFTIAGTYTKAKVRVKIRLCKAAEFKNTLMLTTGSMKHLNVQLNKGKKIIDVLNSEIIESEEQVYAKLGIECVVPELREGTFELALAQEKKLPKLIEMSDLKGILHNHSTYSDGRNTLREMAEHCKSMGYEYLGISDHSQTAVYASGLKEHEVKAQQEEIKKLNEELAPFKIFSGIESDILADGSLDYSDETLNSFDFIVASIHSGLNMDIQKATDRLLAAIKNPYTTFLGHMTGRILLQREGYSVDHKTIIDACAVHKVIIELNSSPYRLDIDWRWVHYAIEQGVMLSLNPDAHRTTGYDDMKYGLLAGRKGGLTKEMNFNSKSLAEVEQYFSERK